MQLKKTFSDLLIALLFVAATLSTSCSHREAKIEAELDNLRCDDAIEHLSEQDPMIKLVDKTQHSLGTVLSYSYVGASYTVEYVWDFLGGTLVFVTLCGPAILAGIAAPSEHAASQLSCLSGRLDALKAPHLGKQAYRQTQPMRCPDLKSFSRTIRKVADCYERKGGAENLNKAMKNLKSLRDSEEFYLCLPQEEQDLIHEKIDSLKNIAG